MDKRIAETLEASGFAREIKRVRAGRCPFCGTIPIVFRDELSRKEFQISGLCQECQDDFFGKKEKGGDDAED